MIRSLDTDYFNNNTEIRNFIIRRLILDGSLGALSGSEYKEIIEKLGGMNFINDYSMLVKVDRFPYLEKFTPVEKLNLFTHTDGAALKKYLPPSELYSIAKLLPADFSWGNFLAIPGVVDYLKESITGLDFFASLKKSDINAIYLLLGSPFFMNLVMTQPKINGSNANALIQSLPGTLVAYYFNILLKTNLPTFKLTVSWLTFPNIDELTTFLAKVPQEHRLLVFNELNAPNLHQLFNAEMINRKSELENFNSLFTDKDSKQVAAFFESKYLTRDVPQNFTQLLDKLIPMNVQARINYCELLRINDFKRCIENVDQFISLIRLLGDKDENISKKQLLIENLGGYHFLREIIKTSSDFERMSTFVPEGMQDITNSIKTLKQVHSALQTVFAESTAAASPRMFSSSSDKEIKQIKSSIEVNLKFKDRNNKFRLPASPPATTLADAVKKLETLYESQKNNWCKKMKKEPTDYIANLNAKKDSGAIVAVALYEIYEKSAPALKIKVSYPEVKQIILSAAATDVKNVANNRQTGV